ncbi:hypothetical protein TNCV_1412011 [Trichonephila clavipes]|nr:hypothetical protein TNCV_1412011 [Trichonephila clavipes]
MEWSSLNNTVLPLLPVDRCRSGNPNGYDRELMVGIISIESWVQVKMLLKTSRVSDLLNVQSVEAESPQVCMRRKFEEQG